MDDNTHTIINHDPPSSISDTINKMEQIFINIKNITYPEINDTFYVYRLSASICINLTDSSYFLNSTTIKVNDIIYNPTYVSTTYSQCAKLNDLINFASYIYKIKITKENKSWLFLNKYSTINRECEILINKNTAFKVTNISYGPILYTVKGYETVRDILIIEVELYEDIEKLVLEVIQSMIEQQYKLDNGTMTGGTPDKIESNMFYNCNIDMINKIIKTNSKININPKCAYLFDLYDIYPSEKINKINLYELYNLYLENYIEINKKELIENKILNQDTLLNKSFKLEKGPSMRNKYIKYKNKYLQLKDELSKLSIN
jgi:hypothetical protein